MHTWMCAEYWFGKLAIVCAEAIGRAAEQAEIEGSSTIRPQHLERILPKLLLDF